MGPARLDPRVQRGSHVGGREKEGNSNSAQSPALPPELWVLGQRATPIRQQHEGVEVAWGDAGGRGVVSVVRYVKCARSCLLAVPPCATRTCDWHSLKSGSCRRFPEKGNRSSAVQLISSTFTQTPAPTEFVHACTICTLGFPPDEQYLRTVMNSGGCV